MKKTKLPKECKLTRVEYLQWTKSIEVMGRKKSELQNVTDMITISELQAKISRLLIKSRLDDANLNLDNSKKDYEELKLAIEARLGISLNEKMIDEVTLEVLDLPKEV